MCKFFLMLEKYSEDLQMNELGKEFKIALKIAFLKTEIGHSNKMLKLC